MGWTNEPVRVLASFDKALRDQAYRDLKQNGNEFEKKAIKDSSVEAVPGQAGKFKTVWRVLYPKSPDEKIY